MTNHQKTILIVDDDHRGRDTLVEILNSANYRTVPAENGAAALETIKSVELNLVLLDLILPDINGLEILRRVKKEKPLLPVIIISGYGTIKDAVEATRAGAYDFLEKGSFDKNRFLFLIQRALEKEKIEKEIILLKEELLKKYQMVGISPTMINIFRMIEEISPTDASVLITGESGVGKELVARAIHNRSRRLNNPFIKINCAAIPKELIESELFGYEKGAFTDAKTSKQGKLEIANGGTLFLDEIGDMILTAQAKILRFLQEGEFERLGSTATHKVDVRIIAATNKNLQKEITDFKFREDLFYRLNVLTIHVPPLRDRKEDIPALADFFLSTICEEHGIAKKELTPDAVNFLMNHPWRGNCRELRNVIERAVIIIKSQQLNSTDFIKIIEYGEPPALITDKSLKDARDDFEREYILKLLSKYNWNLSMTAQILNIDRAHLYRKMRKLHIKITSA